MLASDIVNHLTSRPPRHLPREVLKLAKALYTQQTGLVAFGIFFCAFSVPFMIFLFPWRMLDALALDFGKPIETSGRVTNVSEADITVNDERVWQFGFVFSDALGDEHSGVCYASERDWENQQRVTVQYLAKRPSVARIKGTRLDEAGYAASFIGLFPLVGGLILYTAISTAQKRQWLLQYGEPAMAKVTNVERTNWSENYKNVFKLHFAFESVGRPCETHIRTVEDDLIWLATERQRDNESILILYDPRKPKKVLIAESLLPGKKPHGPKPV